MTDTTGSHESLRDIIRAYRKRAGLTQAEVASLAGLSVAGVRDIEQGRVVAPRADTIRQLGAALGLPAAVTARLAPRPLAGDSAANLWIGVLGPLTVRVDGVEVDPGSDLQRALLGLLALSPNLTVGRERLLSLVATADRPATVAALAARISRLRRRIRPASMAHSESPIVACDGGYRLVVGDDQIDLLEFRSLVRQARRMVAQADLSEAWRLYRRAVDLWRDEPLAGLSLLADDPAVVGLIRQWPTVATEFAAVGADLGHHAQVVPILHKVIAVDPLHEVANAHLMMALAGTGRQTEALQVFDRLRRRLDRDLGIQPGPELLEAHRRVLRQQVGRPVSPRARTRRSLPADVPDFVGRQEELRRLRDWATDDTRAGDGPTIILIEGMAGVGKTRLALRLAHHLAADGRYPDQQLYADLGTHTSDTPADPSAVLASFLHLVGVPDTQIPEDLPCRLSLYRQQLNGTRTLLLLDDAANAQQVVPLLPASPHALCLVTSRRRLRLPGAHRLSLGEFSRDEALQALEAVLGRERMNAEPEAAEQIVDACGRLPLAVGLVARRLQARPLVTFTDAARRLADDTRRLSELAAGGRSVRESFDQSHRRLSEERRHQLQRLCQAGREFSVAAAATHLGTTLADAGRILEDLHEVHLLARRSGNRYCLHDLVRDYLREVG